MNVSECGTGDKLGLDTLDKKSSIKLLDAFFDVGGNFTDAANHHQDETSAESGPRRVVSDTSSLSPPSIPPTTNAVPTPLTSRLVIPATMRVSVRGSLRKLRTECVDILYYLAHAYSTVYLNRCL
ncbi:hypothetical protein NEOLEDRAFT_787116 [Neolentinus lepideus HHB14362 ss-1]|uniref:NADP-dependent oxidoreductase domain-containing protein n=1 Tax=Neolentinus lepideus HHB14362 ss-1 TaxID=1314782 RepID=A0A165UYS6_9AGAM|nr:hypothetical protein NEOLEDRAFT_787116 [Neolentinus lepideus HHB14362 ss-1]